MCQQLESVPFNRSKPAILAEYLRRVPEREASWALYLLLGGQLPRLVANADLQKWVLTESGIPEWLFEECREKAGDFAETVALLGELACRPLGASVGPELSLSQWIEDRLLPLAAAGTPAREAALRECWRTHSIDVSWAVHALAVGRFPVHVPRRVAEDAVREAWASASADPVALFDSRIAALPTGPVAACQLDLFS
jgi:DNA ligase-1